MKLILSALLLVASLNSFAQIITTFAGNGIAASTGDSGPATAASINGPGSVTFDGSGNVYISGYYSHTIRKVSPSGIITTIAGVGTPGFSGDGGPATAAQLSNPARIMMGSAGDLYVCDMGNNRVRKISPSGIITTFAGNGLTVYSGDGGPATASSLFHPLGLEEDNDGNIYISDYDHYRIRKVNTTGIITTVIGTGVPGSGGDGGPATLAQVNRPWGLRFDAADNLYVADQRNHKVRVVSPSGIITTFAGVGTIGYSGDGGPATAAQLFNVSDIDFDAAGNVYLDDQENNVVRMVSPSGEISTVIGTGVAGYSGDGGPAIAAQINGSNAFGFSPAGKLYICDNSNNRVRLITTCGASITGQPVHDTAIVGDSAAFTVTTTLPGLSYQWQQNSGSGFVNLVDVPPYSGVNTATLLIRDVSLLLDGTEYRCYVNNEFSCPDTSEAATLTVGAPSSISQTSIETELKILPNPAHDFVTVYIANDNRKHEIQLINNLGQVLHSEISDSNTTRLQLANLPSGVYYLRVQTDKFVMSKRLLIQ